MLATLGARLSSADAVANKGGNEALHLPLQAGRSSARNMKAWEGAESKFRAELASRQVAMLAARHGRHNHTKRPLCDLQPARQPARSALSHTCRAMSPSPAATASQLAQKTM